MDVNKIIAKFGGQSALARMLGKGQSTVAYWVKAGSIPSKWQIKLVQLARENQINLLLGDFIGTPENEEKLPDSGGDRATPTQHAVVPITSDEAPVTSQFLFYAAGDGTHKVQVIVRSDTVWTTQKGMSEIFGTSRENVTMHLQNIFEEGELDQLSVCKDFLLTAPDGKNYTYKLYNLDAIISVGYRVSSYQATQFRKWATTILREYLVKGFALDDARLKQGGKLFDKDYFEELLDRIRAIRSSEKLFYKKITDLYSQCSVDYDPHAPISHQFYAHVQDKLHYATHGHTSSELIKLRADAKLPNMGLQTFEGARVTKAESKVGKNYLNLQEAQDLNRLVTMYLDFAENLVKRNQRSGTPMKMQDWVEKLDSFLEFNGFPLLKSFGTVRRDRAEQHAIAEYEKYRTIALAENSEEFERVSEAIRTSGKAPSERAILPSEPSRPS